MRLNVLPASTVDAARVLDLFDRARAEYCALGLEITPLDVGSAVCAAEYLPVYDVNALFDARLPHGLHMQTAWEAVEEHFRSNGSQCLQVRISRAAMPGECDPLIDWLTRLGWREYRRGVHRLVAALRMEPTTHTIVSARAAFSEYERFSRLAVHAEPKLAQVSVLKLDDPRYDVLVLLIHGKIVARAGVLSLGETGLIEQVAVLADERGKGFGRAVMQRAIELCERSQFKHVLLGCDSTNEPAKRLYASLGFAEVGESAEWRAATFA